MVRRRGATSKIPLEWKTDVVTVSDATVTNGEFDLDLLPDEVAEIQAVKSIISLANIPDAANDVVSAAMYLSMDPDAIGSPLTDAILEDLEIFYHHRYTVQQEIGAAGSFSTRLTDKNEMVFFNRPLLLGTNFAQVVVGDASIGQTYITTVYFKRKKASGEDLTNILLKRR